MSKELLALVQRVKLRQYAESPPKQILYNILDEIEQKQHYGRMRNWELLTEFLARWLVQNRETERRILQLGGYPSCLPFHGLPLKTRLELYEHIDKLDLFRHYFEAAQKSPWDHLGEIWEEQRLFGPGQNLTPRAIVEFMIKTVYSEWSPEADLLSYESYQQYVAWYQAVRHAPPTHIKPMEFPLKTQLDPCTGTGRFLIVPSLMMPKAPIVLFGIEINLSLYRACLVNMALFSQHPYSIICADTLMIDERYSGVNSKVWDLGNRWNPPDMTPYYWKPPPIWHDRFSLKAFVEKKVSEHGKRGKDV